MLVNEMVKEVTVLKMELEEVNTKIQKYKSRLTALNAEGARLGTMSPELFMKATTIVDIRLPSLRLRKAEIANRLSFLTTVLRQQKRCRSLRKEIIAAAYHPRKVEQWLEKGGFELVESILG